MAHPAVKKGAAIGIPCLKWHERPLLIVVFKDKQTLSREELLVSYQDKVAS